MEEGVNFKKVFLITMIISLSISALIGIILFLIGSFGEIQARILFTTLTIGGFSLTALCSAALYDKHHYTVFSLIGIIVAVLGFLVITFGIWEIFDISNLWKLMITLIILSASLAQISLLLFVKSDKTLVNISLVLTLLFISIVAIMILILVFSEWDIGSEIYYRFLGVFAILDVLGTIITPILLKVTSMGIQVPQELPITKTVR